MNELISLANLFNKKIFRIPDYQRGYAWKEQQLIDFWDDLYNLNGERYHYTGLLSLKELNKCDWDKWEDEKWILTTKGYKAYHVVDGQQRLTTFIILLNSILNYADSIGKSYINGDDLEEIRNQYIVEYKKPEKILKAYKFGYEKDNPSFEYLRYAILGEESPGSLQETFYTLNLKNAKDFFDNQINKLYKEKGYSAIEYLFMKLTNKLQFNIHDIGDDFDVFVAFETMNNRGKKLSNLEILKNRLIYLTTIYPDNILNNDEKDQLRRDINDSWREVYFQLGRNKLNPLDDDEYLKNHWTMYFKYSRTTGDDYINFLLNVEFTPKSIYGEKAVFEYTKRLEDDFAIEIPISLIDAEDGVLQPIEIKDYVKNLKEVAQFWYYSFNPEDCNIFTSDEKLWINRLNRIGIAYFRTLIVSSFLNKNITSEQRVRLFKSIENFIFLEFRMARYQSSYLSNKPYNFARDLMKGQIDIENIIEFYETQFNKDMKGAVDSFVNVMNKYFNNYDGYYSWSDLKYVLFEYEAELALNKAVPKLTDWSYFTKSEKDKVSIEHIFPQKPSKWYWRNQFRKYTDNENEIKLLTNSLGNLLALSQSVNSSLQNDDFDNKKKPSKDRCGYSNGSYSEIEVAEKYKDWTPESILDRGLNLLGFIEKRWGVVFPSEEYKINLLGLSFLKEDRPDVPEVEEVDYTCRDDYFKGEKSEIRVSEYLNKKDILLVAYYQKIYDKLKIRIPSLYETATNNYIALRCAETNKILAEIHIQNSKRKICILTRTPDIEHSGEKLPENFLWTLNYRIYLKEDENFEDAINTLYEVYQQIKETNLLFEDDLEESRILRINRINNILEILKKYEENEKIKMLHSSGGYLRFTTPIIRDKVGLLGDGSWSGIQDLIVYEINIGKDKSKLSLFIGPSNSELKNRWVSFAEKNTIFKVLNGNKWIPIFRMTLFRNNDDTQMIEKLKQFLNETMPLIDGIFQNN